MATNTQPDSYGMNGSSKNPSHTATTGRNAATAIDAERAKSSLTFKEVVAPGLMVEVELRRILAGPVQSAYQKIEILDTYFGKVNISFPFFCWITFFEKHTVIVSLYSHCLSVLYKTDTCHRRENTKYTI
jgi:hypothetical protein